MGAEFNGNGVGWGAKLTIVNVMGQVEYAFGVVEYAFGVVPWLKTVLPVLCLYFPLRGPCSIIV